VSSAAGDSVVPESGDDSTDLALQSYRQGDVLPDLRSLATLRARRAATLTLGKKLAQAGRALRQVVGRQPLGIKDQSRWVEEPTPNGAVVISQTCDVVRTHRERPTVQAAKLTQLEGDWERQAADGRRPRFVAVPNAGAGWYADLEVIGTIDKRVLVGLSRQEGVVDDEQVRRFAAAVGRNFSRFPFPDEVSEQLKPLVDDVRGKYGSATSPLGRVLQHVMELRLEARPRWDDPDAVITLIVICDPGVLPTFEDPQDVPTNLAQWLRRDSAGITSRSPNDIAVRLLEVSPSSVEAWHLWDQLGRVWARRCSRINPMHGTGTAHEFHAEVLSADEFTLDRVRRSEIVDVDYLSPPTPAEAPAVEDETAP
jgi:hypothetical protein